MSSAKKTEANRRNAQKSSGPKSAEGKSRSRFNAVKHGMRADLAVLPGEDEAAFRSRVDAWTSDLKPRNEVEQYLVDRAAKVAWQLDRIERAYVARLTANINNAVADAALGLNQPEGEGENVPLLGSRLFWDTRGPLTLYPHSPPDGHSKKQFLSWSGDVNDPNSPGPLVLSLESTAKGCNWLLDRWAELRSILEQGKAWQSPDKLKAIRLLGRQPLEAFDDPHVGIVFLACHQLDPNGGELFHEIWKELEPSDRKIAKQRLAGRPLDSVQPQSEVEARQALFGIIDQAVGRLQSMAATHRERAEANARLLPAQLAFDDSMQGERLRRYETSCSRTLLRTLDAFDKRHRAAADDDDDDADGIDLIVPASINEHVPVSAVEIEPGVEITTAFATESAEEPIQMFAPIANSAISQSVEPADASVQSQHEPAANGDNAELPNEPTALVSAHDNAELPNEPTAANRRHRNSKLPNKLMAFISRHLNPELPNEPTALICLQDSGARKQIESGTLRGDRGAKPTTGPNRRERRGQTARSRKTKSDLTSLHPQGNHLNRKPP